MDVARKNSENAESLRQALASVPTEELEVRHRLLWALGELGDAADVVFMQALAMEGRTLARRTPHVLAQPAGPGQETGDGEPHPQLDEQGHHHSEVPVDLQSRFALGALFSMSARGIEGAASSIDLIVATGPEDISERAAVDLFVEGRLTDSHRKVLASRGLAHEFSHIELPELEFDPPDPDDLYVPEPPSEN